MSKIYTAQEMRELANKLESRSELAVCRYDGEYDEWQPIWKNPDDTILALRQAANALEHEEKREKKYEYSYKYGYDSIDSRHSEDVKGCFVPLGAVIVRREVGEWEEVK